MKFNSPSPGTSFHKIICVASDAPDFRSTGRGRVARWQCQETKTDRFSRRLGVPRRILDSFECIHHQKSSTKNFARKPNGLGPIQTLKSFARITYTCIRVFRYALGSPMSHSIQTHARDCHTVVRDTPFQSCGKITYLWTFTSQRLHGVVSQYPTDAQRCRRQKSQHTQEEPRHTNVLTNKVSTMTRWGAHGQTNPRNHGLDR